MLNNRIRGHARAGTEHPLGHPQLDDFLLPAKMEEAEDTFKKAVALKPDNPAALNGLGQVYLARHKFDLAETYLLKAAPKAPAAWTGLARIYLLQGKFDQAQRWAKNIVDAGQADELTRKMLEAAQNKNVPEGLRLMIEPQATQ